MYSVYANNFLNNSSGFWNSPCPFTLSNSQFTSKLRHRFKANRFGLNLSSEKVSHQPQQVDHPRKQTVVEQTFWMRKLAQKSNNQTWHLPSLHFINADQKHLLVEVDLMMLLRHIQTQLKHVWGTTRNTSQPHYTKSTASYVDWWDSRYQYRFEYN